MIFTPVLQWILADSTAPTIPTLLGGNKVYFAKVPTVTPAVVLPWVVFSIKSNPRRIRSTRNYTEHVVELQFDIEHTLPNAGETLAEKVWGRLENYRGDMGTMLDSHITCSPIWEEDGYNASYCFRFVATVRYKKARTVPV